VRRAVREAAQTLADQGAQIEPMTPPNIHTAMELITAVLSADGSANLRRLLRGSVIDPRIRRMLLLGSLPNITRGLVAGGLAWARQASQGSMVRTARRRSASEYWELNFQVQTFRREVLEHLASTCDALVLPPYALPAPKHGQALDLIPAASDCLLINLLGLPSGVVPVTAVQSGEESDRPTSLEQVAQLSRDTEVGSAGLPIGVQVVSHYWREDLVLAVMKAIENGRSPGRL
jgi:Asp-tRNA(Asn)/Glu-tRNA(Gln) amidotransferase A subunit family amidase